MGLCSQALACSYCTRSYYSANRYRRWPIAALAPCCQLSSQVLCQEARGQLNLLAHLKCRQAAVGAAPAAEGIAQAALRKGKGRQGGTEMRQETSTLSRCLLTNQMANKSWHKHSRCCKR